MRRIRASVTATAIAVSVIIGVAACSPPAEDDGPAVSTPAESGALPVTIDHKFGSTTIEASASRIATLGPGDADTLLALGITPTTMVPFSDPSGKTVIGPWNEKLLEGKNPVVLGDATQDLAGSVTKALATDPDLIIAVNNAVTQPIYDNLSKVAKTVVRPADAEDWQIPWTESTTAIGKAVGKPAETAKLIEDTKKAFTDAKAAHPQLAGTTGAVIDGSAAGGVYIYNAGDGRGQMLANLGMEFPAQLESSITSGFYGQISDENLNLLNSLDKVVVVDWQGSAEALKRRSVWANLDIVKRGDVVYLDQVTASAMSVPTVLTIPWVLSTLAPKLAS